MKVPLSFDVRRYRIALAIGIVCVLLAASGIALLIPRENFHELGKYGYVGVFAATLLGTLPLFVPVPYFVAIFIAGGFLNPLSVAVVAGVAVVLGELVGYSAGYVGEGFIPDKPWVGRIERLMARFGTLVVFVTAFAPNPFFKVVGVLAGATHMPLWRFCISCFLGKTLRFWLIAGLGVPLFLFFDLPHPGTG